MPSCLTDSYFWRCQYKVACSRLNSRKLQSLTIVFCFAILIALLGSSLKTASGLTEQELGYPNIGALYDISIQTEHHAPVNLVIINQFIRQQTQFDRIASLYLKLQKIRTINGAFQEYFSSYVSDDYWAITGVTPLLGQLPAQSHEVMISYQFWQDRLSGRSDIIGQTLISNNQIITVSGVLPHDYRVPPYKNIQAVTTLKGPIALWFAQRKQPDNTSQDIILIGQANSFTAKNKQQVESVLSSTTYHHANVITLVTPLLEHLNGATKWLSLFYLITTGIFSSVLICALINLLTSQTLALKTNHALRLTLGASAWQLAIPQAIELGILLAASIIIALPISLLFSKTVQSFSLYQLGAHSLFPPLDITLLLGGLILGLIALLIWLPNKQIIHSPLANLIKTASKGVSKSQHGPLQNMIFSLQLCVSLVMLLCGSVLFQWQGPTFYQAWTHKVSGITAIALKSVHYHGEPQSLTHFRHLLKSTQQLNYDAALISSSPLDLAGNLIQYQATGLGDLAFHKIFISDNYFSVMKSPLLIPKLTQYHHSGDIIASELLHDKIQQLGQHSESLLAEAGIRKVLGTVPESRIANPFLTHFIDHDIGIAYWPLKLNSPTNSADNYHLVIRHDHQKSLPANELEQLLQPFKHHINISSIINLEQEQNNRLSRIFITLVFSVILLGVGLVVATISCYSLCYNLCVSKRSEFGLKLALGAHPQRLITDFLLQLAKNTWFALTMTVVLSLGGIWLLTQVLKSLSTLSFFYLIITVIVFILCVVSSCIAPLRKFIYKSNPMSSLRED